MVSKIVVFAGPSGVGKATIEKQVFEALGNVLCLAVSATTRQRRENEIEGSNYYFINEESFNKKINNNEFLEWNQHFENFYGTLKSEIKRIQKLNKAPFLEIEVDGAREIFRSIKKENILSIFIKSPSIEALKERLVLRNTENADQLETRIKRADYELQFQNQFDHVIINDDATVASSKIIKLIRDFLDR